MTAAKRIVARRTAEEIPERKKDSERRRVGLLREGGSISSLLAKVLRDLGRPKKGSGKGTPFREKTAER